VTFEHLLRKNALLPEDKIAEAKHLEAAEGLRLDRAVVQLGLMSEREVLKIMAEQLMLPLLDLSATEIPPDILQSLTTKVVFRKRIVPIAREGNTLRVATCDPFDLYAMDDVRMTTGLQIDTVLAIKDDIEKLIKTHYGLGGDTLDELAANDDEPSGTVSGGGEDLDFGAILGAGALYLIASGSAGWTGGLGANGYGAGYLGEYSLTAALVFEAVMTFLFVTVILGATGSGSAPGFAGLAIGLTLAAIHLVGINVTGVSVNPARSIGPALFSGGSALTQLWVFIVAPLVGGLLAGALYKAGFTRAD
jgi:hypothetical protein